METQPQLLLDKLSFFTASWLLTVLLPVKSQPRGLSVGMWSNQFATAGLYKLICYHISVVLTTCWWNSWIWVSELDQVSDIDFRISVQARHGIQNNSFEGGSGALPIIIGVVVVVVIVAVFFVNQSKWIGLALLSYDSMLFKQCCFHDFQASRTYQN